MKRVELFEFEDFDWFPKVIRSGMTNLIIVFHRLLGTEDVLVSLIQNLRKKVAFSQIIDLGSGSGGPMPGIIEKINKQSSDASISHDEPIKLLLTDLHPHPEIVQTINNKNTPNVKYHDVSVNAVNIQDAPSGLKTMIASFHHMNPTIAKSILQSAQDNKQPILIYELAKNNIPLIIWILLLPLSLIILILMAVVLTLFVRPLRWHQVLLTLIPIIPIAYAWDGQASLMRTYTFDDIEEMIERDESDEYEWEIGDAFKANGKKAGYFVVGRPIGG